MTNHRKPPKRLGDLLEEPRLSWTVDLAPAIERLRFESNATKAWSFAEGNRIENPDGTFSTSSEKVREFTIAPTHGQPPVRVVVHYASPKRPNRNGAVGIPSPPHQEATSIRGCSGIPQS